MCGAVFCLRGIKFSLFLSGLFVRRSRRGPESSAPMVCCLRSSCSFCRRIACLRSSCSFSQRIQANEYWVFFFLLQLSTVQSARNRFWLHHTWLLCKLLTFRVAASKLSKQSHVQDIFTWGSTSSVLHSIWHLHLLLRSLLTNLLLIASPSHPRLILVRAHESFACLWHRGNLRTDGSARALYRTDSARFR